MAIPEDKMAEASRQLDAYCKGLISPHAYGKIQIGYIIKGRTITLHRSYPRFNDQSKWADHGVARIRYTKKEDSWTLYFLDRNLKWQRYTKTDPTDDFSEVLAEIKKDPTCIFWG